MAWPMSTTSGTYLNRFLTLPECLRPVPSLVWVNSPWPVSQERGWVSETWWWACVETSASVFGLYSPTELPSGSLVMKVKHPHGR